MMHGRLEASLVAADWVILMIVGGSCLIALFRGLVREALSLANWVIAALLARGFADLLSQVLAQWIDTASIRYLIAFSVLMALSLIVGGLLIKLVVKLVHASGLGFADRMLGLVFGLARGVLLVMLGLALLRYGLPIEEDDWWQASRLVPMFNAGLDWLLPRVLEYSDSLTNSIT